ncbi:lipase modulator protein [Marinomonas sp. MED121]|uniref:lipase secretion chaperone n=1 Tax=Marinomonas sp. MED121 TaxID=314277 RepID=UPI0000690BA4|nr:lipase secretion chaperone [Marinomonas sp. MED121]EAQ65873.1 lipase modulator protein [Marinomonas sp. MED121]
MKHSLIKKLGLIAFAGAAFLGLANWVGVAYIAAPVQMTSNQDKLKVEKNSDSAHLIDPKTHVLKETVVANIEKELNLKDNPAFSDYQNKVRWLAESSSLRGTQVGGAYPVDAEGRLVAHISIKQRFDYFMTLLGELSYGQLIDLIKEDIRQSLVDPAQSEALALLEQYQAYKYALKTLDDEFSQVHVALTDRMAIVERQISLYQAIDLLRYEYFEQDYRQAFFADEIASEQALIASLQGSNTQTDSNDGDKLTQVISRLELQSEENGEDLFVLQSQAFGIEAAQRLANVRGSRQVLKTKVLAFMDQKKAIQSSSLSLDLQQQEIENLIALNFSDSEKKRLATLEKIYQ